MSDIAPLTGLIAHQGGWDEVLLVGIPILLIIGLLAIAKRRVDAHAAAGRDGHDDNADTHDTADTDDNADTHDVDDADRPG